MAVPAISDEEDVTTESLLNNTVFYKVAHHVSHNGTAQRLGLEMMNHPDLVAMAPLNYDVIAPGWKNTMPNRAIMKLLLERTRGRTIVQNTKGLFYDPDNETPLTEKIEEFQEFLTQEEFDDFHSSLIDDTKFVEIQLKV